jgi:hypothetical protein
MKKAISLFLIVLFNFAVILQSFALVVPYTSSDNEKAIYAK